MCSAMITLYSPGKVLFWPVVSFIDSTAVLQRGYHVLEQFSCKPLCRVGEEVQARGSFVTRELWMRWEQAMRCTGWTSPAFASHGMPKVSITTVVFGYRVLGPILVSVSSSNKMMIRYIFSLV